MSSAERTWVSGERAREGCKFDRSRAPFRFRYRELIPSSTNRGSTLLAVVFLNESMFATPSSNDIVTGRRSNKKSGVETISPPVGVIEPLYLRL